MRRALLPLLRCPRCQRGQLLPETDAPEVVFGPLRCDRCEASYPVAEGVADLVLERDPPRALQREFESPWVARAWERYVRPAALRMLSLRPLDADSEYLLYRSLLGRPEAPVLALGCGTGMFARRLAREPDLPSVVALDISKAMLEEAVAQAREASAMVDFLRAQMPELPFADGALGAVLLANSLHHFADPGPLLREVVRVLRPGGRFVASSYLPPGLPARVLQKRAGLFPRSLDELRGELAASGLVRIERIQLPPFIAVEAEKA